MTEHELKTWPEYYEAVHDGRKPFEYRLNDRNFQVGDVLWLREYVPTGEVTAASYEDDGGGIMDTGYYTGREMRRTVTYILHIEELGPGAGARIASAKNFVIMGLSA